LVGAVITQFNEKGCDAMTISSTMVRTNICSGNHEWTYIGLIKTTGLAVKMDINFVYGG
jgi:hypothetical protein